MSLSTSSISTNSFLKCTPFCNHDSCLISIIRGIRNGCYYGMKVRLPHAFVMTFLFKTDASFKDKLYTVYNATFTHSKNLGFFVGLFKTLRCLIRYIRYVDCPSNTIIAGFIAGAVVFGKENPINSQINMYILSRVILGSVSALVKNEYLPTIPHAYTIFAGLCWGMVMYLHSYQYKTTNKSLAISMDYLYNDSDKWPKLNINDKTFESILMGIIEWFYNDK